MRLNGRLLGALLILHLVCGLTLPYVFLLPLTGPPAAFLEQANAVPALIRLNVLILLFGASVSAVISLMLARAYFLTCWFACAAASALAVAALVLQIVEIGHWLTMLSVSDLYAAAPNKEQFLVSGSIIRTGFKWAHYSHILVAVAWLFAFYYLCWRARIVPPFLALLGMVACALHLGGIVVPVFAGVVVANSALFGIPLAVVTVAASGWLLVRGIRHSGSDPITGTSSGSESH